MTKAKEKPEGLPSSTSDPATTRTNMVADAHQTGKTRKDNRCRNYTAILYPESAVEGWQDILAAAHVEALVSPLHDRDVTPEGEKKKDHYHVMVMYQGNKSLKQAQELFDSLGATKCQPINSIRGEARYLCHLDNPEKEQYDVKDVLEFGGADYQGIIGLPSDKYGILRELMAFIEMNDVLSFSELSRWCAENNERWFRALADNCTYYIKEYLSSRQYSIEKNLISRSKDWVMEPQARQLSSVPASQDPETDPGEEVPF